MSFVAIIKVLFLLRSICFSLKSFWFGSCGVKCGSVIGIVDFIFLPIRSSAGEYPLANGVDLYASSAFVGSCSFSGCFSLSSNVNDSSFTICHETLSEKDLLSVIPTKGLTFFYLNMCFCWILFLFLILFLLKCSAFVGSCSFS